MSVRLGQHWLAEATGCDPARTLDPEVVRSVLEELPERLGLLVVGGPEVHANDDGSVVGVVLLAVSHGSVHVPPSGDAVLVDVFSCEPFDPTPCVAVVQEAFAPGSLASRVVDRGS